MKKIIIGFGALILIAGAFYFVSEQRLVQHETVEEVEVIAEDAVEEDIEEEVVAEEEKEVLPPVEDLEIESADKSVTKAFEDTINDLLENVSEALVGYNRDRKVIEELTLEENIRDPEFVEKNMEVMTKTAADMRDKAQAILDSFDAADVKIRDLLADMPEKSRKSLISKWDDLVAENAGRYRRVFEEGAASTQAHASLLRYYYTHRDSYIYDEEKGAIVFDTPEQQEYARLLLVQVNRAKRTQNMLLSR